MTNGYLDNPMTARRNGWDLAVAANDSSFTRYDQSAYMAVIAAASAVVAVAYRLQPAAQGFGTHRQLGLPPCPFHSLTGLPCPGCGLTTSFAHAAKLHLVEAFIAQPFGLLAFFLTLLSIPCAAYLIRRRLPWQMLFEIRLFKMCMYATFGAFLLGWVYKLMIM
jgi:hypothetical protein